MEIEKVKHRNRQAFPLTKGDRDSLSVLYLKEERQLAIVIGQENDFEPPFELPLSGDSQQLTEK